MESFDYRVGNYVHVFNKNKLCYDFVQIIEEDNQLIGVSITEQKKYQLVDCYPIRLNSQIIESLELEEVKYKFPVRYKNEFEVLFKKYWLKDASFALLSVYNIQKYKDGCLSFHPLIITGSKVLKEGIDWNRIEEYEQEGIVKSCEYLHKLQNYMFENPNYGELDFTKITLPKKNINN